MNYGVHYMPVRNVPELIRRTSLHHKVKNTRRLLLIALAFIASSCFFLPNASAQSWQWAKAGLGTVCEGWAVSVDPAGNIFGGGEVGLSGTLHFGSITDSVSIWQAAWVKYAPAGNPLWSGFTTGDGCTLNNICADAAGNLIVYGVMNGFTTGIGPYTLVDSAAITATFDLKYFIAKISPSGTVLWAKCDGSNVGAYDHMSGLAYSPVVISNGGVATDRHGNIYISGYYEDSLTIGTYTFHSAGDNDAFLAKYSPAGTLLWANSLGGTGKDIAEGITVTPAGNVYISGYTYSPSFTVGSSTVSNPHSGEPAAFIAKFSGSGTPQWVQGAGGPNGAFALGIASDNYDNAYITGGFGDTSISFGATTLTRSYPGAVPHLALYLTQYSPAGVATWSKTIGSYHRDLWGFGVAMAPCGQVWVSGNYSDTSKIDSITLYPPPGFWNDPLFIAGYNLSGGVAGYNDLRSGGDDQNGIACDASGNVFVCGDLIGSITTATDTITYSGDENIFVAKYRNTIGYPDTVYQQHDTTICNASIDSTTITAPAGYVNYYWNDGATDSSRTFYNTGTYWVYCLACGEAVLIDTFHLVNPTALDTFSVRRDTSVCQFSDIPVPVTLSAPGGGINYNWYNGDTTQFDTVGYPGVYWVSYQAHCAVYVDTFVVHTIPKPPPILGHDTICVGDFVSLSDSVAGGKWTSSNPAIASVDSLSGVAAGISADTVTVAYIITNGCSTTRTETVLAPPCVNAVAETPAQAGEVFLYPVPAKNELVTKMTTPEYNSVVITDLVGQALMSQEIKTLQNTLDISKLPSGLYYITFKGHNGALTKKFVKE